MKIVHAALPPRGARLVGYLREPSGEMPAYAVRPAVIVCPGGGYAFRSDREADPVALQFAAAGYQAFVVEYTVAGHDGAGAPLGLTPLIELSCAVSAVRAHAGAWAVDPERVAVCGFSAGGHLAASLGVHWNAARLRRALEGVREAPAREGENRPDALVLCYPVVTAGEFAHRGSIENLTAGGGEDRAWFSLERHVSPGTPPAFLWHTVSDEGVPVENTLLFARGLRGAGVPFECHLFESGAHGMSLATDEVATPCRHNAAWLPLCLDWLGARFAFNRF